jgi:purine-nucleoside phosphorylase
VAHKIQSPPNIGIVLGSGLTQLTRLLHDSTRIEYAAIPHFPISRVPGHQGVLHIGHLGTQSVACLAGRVHGYEGHPPDRVAFGARVLAQLGCRTVILTNAAGALSSDFRPGSLMLIADHLNLTGQNPLVGWHGKEAQFVNMTNAYDSELRALAQLCAKAIPVELREGVYAGLVGPSYETPAEVRMLAHLGAHAVGMSTVHETIALRDLGVRVVGISCITNAAAGIEGSILDHEHVQQVAQASRHKLESLIVTLIERMTGTGPTAR